MPGLLFETLSKNTPRVMNVGMDNDPTFFNIAPYLGSASKEQAQSRLPQSEKPQLKNPFSLVQKVGKGIFNVAKNVFQGTAQSGGSVGLTLTGQKELAIDPVSPRFVQGFQRFLFGKYPVESLGTRIQRFPGRLEEFGINIDSKKARTIAPFAVLGMTALDFIPGGNGAKGAAAIAKLDDPAKIVKVLISDYGVQKSVASEIAPSLVKVTNVD